MLETKGVSSGYKELHILFDIDFKAEKNRITAIVGPNGSGKSTLLKTIFGFTTIYDGRILFEGREITHLPPHEKTKLGIAYLPQTDNVFTDLTVRENLVIAGYILDESEFRDRLELALNVFPELKDKMDRKAGMLSGGERQFLGIASALIRRAKLLMLDEPTAMLSPKFASQVFERVVSLRDDLKLTIILVEQNVLKALEIADNALMLIGGKVAFFGGAKELLEHEKFERFVVGYTL
ncbi:branched-chain amino acid ABC transporter ATP-binding protein [Geoglobus acetivorans]|uniref:Branched-chain amino acid transport ATP-binding protein LivF n=1 Tax=Geoglobus acetivorans TaxID=565033 RepID=A0A0A7GIX0_GEOAI|nr:Branched-chain amino acid transport ATP-binding protein LivF [Geoglobus acetivorans]